MRDGGADKPRLNSPRRPPTDILHAPRNAKGADIQTTKKNKLDRPLWNDLLDHDQGKKQHMSHNNTAYANDYYLFDSLSTFYSTWD